MPCFSFFFSFCFHCFSYLFLVFSLFFFCGNWPFLLKVGVWRFLLGWRLALCSPGWGWAFLIQGVRIGPSFLGLWVGLSFSGCESALRLSSKGLPFRSWAGGWACLVGWGLALPSRGGRGFALPSRVWGFALARLSCRGGCPFLLAVAVRPPFFGWGLACAFVLWSGVGVLLGVGGWPFLLGVCLARPSCGWSGRFLLRVGIGPSFLLWGFAIPSRVRAGPSFSRFGPCPSF